VTTFPAVAISVPWHWPSRTPQERPITDSASLSMTTSACICKGPELGNSGMTLSKVTTGCGASPLVAGGTAIEAEGVFLEVFVADCPLRGPSSQRFSSPARRWQRGRNSSPMAGDSCTTTCLYSAAPRSTYPNPPSVLTSAPGWAAPATAGSRLALDACATRVRRIRPAPLPKWEPAIRVSTFWRNTGTPGQRDGAERKFPLRVAVLGGVSDTQPDSPVSVPGLLVWPRKRELRIALPDTRLPSAGERNVSGTGPHENRQVEFPHIRPAGRPCGGMVDGQRAGFGPGSAQPVNHSPTAMPARRIQVWEFKVTGAELRVVSSKTRGSCRTPAEVGFESRSRGMQEGQGGGRWPAGRLVRREKHWSD